MVKKKRKKPGPRRKTRWGPLLVFAGVSFAALWLWLCLSDPNPEFKYLLITKNDQELKLLNGEILPIHPHDRIAIKKVSTGKCFNFGIRLVSEGIDVNALRHETLTPAALLPDRDIFNKHTFRVKIKHYNDDIGYLDFIVEPHVEDWLEKAGRLIKAEDRVALLERAQKLVPENEKIREKLLSEYKAMKQWPRVASMLEERIRENATSEDLHDLLEVYDSISRKNDAITVLERLIEMEPDRVDLRLRLASMLEKSRKTGEAIKAYEACLTLLKDDEKPPIYKTLGYLSTLAERYQEAAGWYLKAADLDPKDVNLYYNLSGLYEKLGRKDRADLYLKKAVELKSEDTENRMKLAERSLERGELKEAEAYAKEVIDKNPKDMEAYLVLLRIAEKRGDKEPLKEIYKKILSLDPDNRTVIHNLGILEYETGRLPESLPYLEKLIRLNPKDAEIHAVLFDIYSRLEKEELALKEARILAELNPKDMQYYPFIFKALERKGDYGQVVEIMEKGLKSHPQNLDLQKYLVLGYLKTGNEEAAIARMHEVLKIAPRDAGMLIQLAQLYHKRGETEEALSAYDRLLEISPDHRDAAKAKIELLLQLARQQEKDGNWEKAMENFKKVMELSPGHEEAEEAYLRLSLKKLRDE